MNPEPVSATIRVTLFIFTLLTMLSFRILTGKQLKQESIVGNEDPLLLLPSPPLVDLNMAAASSSSVFHINFFFLFLLLLLASASVRSYSTSRVTGLILYISVHDSHPVTIPD